MQVAAPRTASTLQFVTLCAAAVIKYGPKQVSCAYGFPRRTKSTRVRVVKSHQEQIIIDKLSSIQDEGRAVIFNSMASDDFESVKFINTSTGDVVYSTVLASQWKEARSKTKEAFTKGVLNHTTHLGMLRPWDAAMQHRLTSRRYLPLAYNISFTQYIPDVVKHGHELARAYQPIFDLTDNQTNTLVDFIEAWIPLRVCCGCQMSQHKTLFLQKGIGELPHHCRDDEGNVRNDIESEFLRKTATFRKFITDDHAGMLNADCMYPMHTLGILIKPSLTDRMLNGSYCETFDKRWKGDRKTDFKDPYFDEFKTGTACFPNANDKSWYGLYFVGVYV